jgi:hypothetical protein
LLFAVQINQGNTAKLLWMVMGNQVLQPHTIFTYCVPLPAVALAPDIWIAVYHEYWQLINRTILTQLQVSRKDSRCREDMDLSSLMFVYNTAAKLDTRILLK